MAKTSKKEFELFKNECRKMNVKTLIEKLKKMPPDAQVKHIWDGRARTTIELVWLAKDNFVATCDHDEMVFDDEDRPKNAPTEKENSSWMADETIYTL